MILKDILFENKGDFMVCDSSANMLLLNLNLQARFKYRLSSSLFCYNTLIWEFWHAQPERFMETASSTEAKWKFLSCSLIFRLQGKVHSQCLLLPFTSRLPNLIAFVTFQNEVSGCILSKNFRFHKTSPWLSRLVYYSCAASFWWVRQRPVKLSTFLGC